MQNVFNYTRKALRLFGVEAKMSKPVTEYADPQILQKAGLIIERFREIVADPLNIMIERVPQAGYVDRDGCVILHNGNRVPVFGDFAYYGDFSDILIINRGVHEPLEEYCFQEVLKNISKTSPVMIELGAYWSHYSMWLKRRCAKANCFMVEPNKTNIEAGKHNFKLNGYDGEFLNKFVSNNAFNVDGFLVERNIDSVDILHSDIQGFEVEMLQGAFAALSKKRIKYVFVSTHSEELHRGVVAALSLHNYRVDVSSGFDYHTTSCDGFVMASSPECAPIFSNFRPMGRIAICRATTSEIIRSINAASEYLYCDSNK